MVNEKTTALKTDSYLKRLIQPMDKKTATELRNNLLSNPDERIVNTWNGYHLNDEETYNLCLLLKLPVQIFRHDFTSYNHAASYICTIQMERTDLTKEYRKYLIGQKFAFEEKIFLSENPGITNAKYRVAYSIGEKINISGGTVMKYNVYASSMNIIFDQSKEFALRILLGKTRVSHENVVELSRLSSDEIRNVSRSVLTDNISHLTFSDIRHEVKYGHTQQKAFLSRRERKEQKETKSAGIRKMPAYDPDSDVNSLCMTICSWISSIERVNQKTDFSAISERAMLELMKQLTILERTISIIQKSLVERNSK